ncbi:MAG: glycosyltransferase [Polyangiaceae bacterium]
MVRALLSHGTTDSFARGVVGRILTFNCHEAYVHLLGKLGAELDIIDALPGRYTQRWDERMRPVPQRARLLTLEQVQAGAAYDAAIAHNLTDLVQLRDLDVPKVLVLHVSLAARCDEEPKAPPPAIVSAHLAKYLELTRATAVAVSRSKATSWGLECPVVRPCADPGEYDGFDGELAVALRVANQVLSRQRRFAWDDHCALVGDLPFKLVGHNPGIDGAEPASSWQALRQLYRRHRAYVHTAGHGLDDGYNLALVEAMTTGMPVVSTALAESPIEDGKNGLVDRDPRRLHAGLAALLVDRARAIELGKRARETALREFSVDGFVGGWQRALELAVRRWATRN